MNPDDEQQRRAELARGQWARQLMDNPLWEEAWDVLYRTSVRAWANSQPGDAQERELLWLEQRAARRLKRQIEQIAQTGQWAEKQLEDLRNG